MLEESRRWKSDWIDLGREEAEVNLWPLLRKETNILRLTNQLHPNQNQFVFFNPFECRLKRLGTDNSSVQIIPPAMTTLHSIVQSIKMIRENTQHIEMDMSPRISESVRNQCLLMMITSRRCIGRHHYG